MKKHSLRKNEKYKLKEMGAYKNIKGGKKSKFNSGRGRAKSAQVILGKSRAESVQKRSSRVDPDQSRVESTRAQVELSALKPNSAQGHVEPS